jgi:lactoylglutathione lyase
VSTSINGIRAIGVPVADQDRALDFYVGVLGLEKRLDVYAEHFGGRWIEVAPPGWTTTIALVPARPDSPSGVETRIRLTTPDAAAMREELRTRGIWVDELLQWEGIPPMFLFRDPDGNGLAIVQS